MLAPSAPSAARFRLISAATSLFTEVISLPYLVLRAWTAGGGLIAGLVQTFVFAHVLRPDQFSIYILIGALGISLWVFDLGISKILFVRLRAKYLAGQDTRTLALQANAIVLLYALMALTGTALCFVVARIALSASTLTAFEFAMFFLFSALNLVWFVQRNLSVAVDEFIYFETLEAVRRSGYIGMLLAMLIGMPVPLFMIAVNLLWIALFTLAIQRLVRRQALVPRLRGAVRQLKRFFRHNYRSALRTGIHGASEIYIHNILYILVPLVFGLGAPTIILDTTIKIFYGTLVLCAAACDVLIPRQTVAFSEHNAPALIRATVVAIGLSALPATIVCAVLWCDSNRLFALLLGSSATVPAAITPILTALSAVAVVRMACNFLLQYTGFFREISQLSIIMCIITTVATGAGLLWRLDIVELLEIYTAVYAVSMLLYVVAAVGGPIRAAAHSATTHPLGSVTAIQSAPQ